jgi:hypothetical protein
LSKTALAVRTKSRLLLNSARFRIRRAVNPGGPPLVKGSDATDMIGCNNACAETAAAASENTHKTERIVGLGDTEN